jgi:hypothetical protein
MRTPRGRLTAAALAPAALLESSNLPLPTGSTPAGSSPALVVGAVPPHPSNVVEVLLRRDGGRVRALRAGREPASAPGATPGDAQWFRTLLPPLRPGSRDEYRIELRRAGRCLAMLPEDGSWRSLEGTIVETAVPRADAPGGRGEASATSTDSWPSHPRYGYDLTFFAALTVNLRAEVLGPTPEGYRINFYVKDGRVAGPQIDAVVQPEGGDWMCIRPDGIGAVTIKITYRTTDGAQILEQAGGVFDLGPDGYARVSSGDFRGAPPFYATPTWSTAHPKWQWLNRCQGFGIGRVVLEKLQVQCDIYLPRVRERLAHG